MVWGDSISTEGSNSFYINLQKSGENKGVDGAVDIAMVNATTIPR